MRCFRVDEDALQGIPLNIVHDELCIEIGDRQLALDPALSAGLMSSRYTVVSKLRECIQTQRYGGRQLSPAELEDAEHLLEVTNKENISLIYADVEGGKNIVREKRRSPDALVLVEVPAGINGRLKFCSTSFDEHIDTKSNRVRRMYKDVFPTPGIQVIESGSMGKGGTCYLLRMMPCSSFRIERTGMLEMPRLLPTKERIYAPRVLTVVWMGKKGKAGSPLTVFSSRQAVE